MPPTTSIFDRLAFPLRLEFLSVPTALALFCLLAAVVVFTGSRSLRWLGPTRQWVAIGLRLCVIWFVVLLLAGAHWQQRNKDVEVMVLRDISASTASAGADLDKQFDQFLDHAAKDKPTGDRIGVVGFDSQAMVDALPDISLHNNQCHAVRSATDGTDIAGAIQTGLASFHNDAMKRLVLVSDGNATEGNTQDALATAASMHIPIDVVPLTYRIRREVMLERIVSPASIRENEPFSIEVFIRSTSALHVMGRLSVTDQDAPLDLDPTTPGVQASMPVELSPGVNPFRIKIPPSTSGVHQFRASFIADNPSDDQLAGNNVAEAFTFVRGKGQVLYVDNTGASAGGSILLDALRAQGITIPSDNRIAPEQFPARLVDLQAYDAVILANVPLGPGGLSAQQDRILAQYVRELGGGLIVIGGPDTLGAGNWQGSELEKVLPVNMEIPAERVMPAGALVLVLDHSGSMSGPMPGAADVSKQTIANESAILALQTLQRDDWIGVIAFDSSPTWVVPLAKNQNSSSTEKTIHAITPAGGTAIVPALDAACDALLKLDPKQVATKRILLMTDGQSEPGNFEAAMKRLKRAGISVSTIAVGADADRPLLAQIAQATGGAPYSVDTPRQLTQVFIREARTLRRQLIHEPKGGIYVMQTRGENELLKGLEGQPLPNLAGMVLTSVKPNPLVHTPLFALGRYRDPILSEWQCGLGRSAVFTGDATRRWGAAWIGSPVFGKFWSQLIRAVERPAMSGDFDVQTIREGTRTRLIVEASDRLGDAINFYSFAGKVAGPRDAPPQDLKLLQTGPGRYETSFDSHEPGNHVAAIEFNGPNGRRGTLLAGVSTQSSLELRDLSSNDAMLADIANRTGGRLLPSLEHGAASVDLFTRDGLSESTSSRPITDRLLVALVGLMIVDVGVRRIAWDWKHVKQMACMGVAYIRSYTTAPEAHPVKTLDSLRKVHEGLASTKQTIATSEAKPIFTSAFAASVTSPEKKADQESDSASPKSSRSFHTGGLLEAKRRAQQHITEMTTDSKQ